MRTYNDQEQFSVFPMVNYVEIHLMYLERPALFYGIRLRMA